MFPYCLSKTLITIPEFSVVSVQSAPYGLVSASAVSAFNDEVDSMYSALSASWDDGSTMMGLQRNPDVLNVTRGYSGINRPGLEQNKNLVDWIFSSELGAIDTFVTSNEDGSRTCYFVRLNYDNPFGHGSRFSCNGRTYQAYRCSISSGRWRNRWYYPVRYDSAASLQEFLAIYAGQKEGKQVQVSMNQVQITGISNTKSLRSIAGAALNLPIGESAVVASGLGDAAVVRRTGDVIQGKPSGSLPNLLAYDAVTAAPLWVPMMALEINRAQNPSYTELMLDLFYALRTKEWSF